MHIYYYVHLSLSRLKSQLLSMTIPKLFEGIRYIYNYMCMHLKKKSLISQAVMGSSDCHVILAFFMQLFFVSFCFASL